MILLLSLLFCSTLCYAQYNSFSAGSVSSSVSAGTPFSQAGVGNSYSEAGSASAQSGLSNSFSQAGSASAQSGLSNSFSQAGSASAQAGVSNSMIGGSSSSFAESSAQASSTISSGTLNYASCVRSQPDTAVKSNSLFSYSLLESTFTNPALVNFYDTSFDVKSFYPVIYDELKATSISDARIVAGSLSLLFEVTFPRISPLVNAVTITNALSDFLSTKVVITTEEFDDYVDAFINASSKGLRNEDGSPKSNAKAIVSALLIFLADKGDLSFSSLNEFISVLAGNYRIALYSNCLPSSFQQIPSP